MLKVTPIITIVCIIMFAARIHAGGDASFEKGITIDESNTFTAVVEKIDHKARTVRLKGAEGNVVDLTVNESAKNFNQVKKGDTLTLTYYGSLFLILQKSRQSPAGSESNVMERVPEGNKPKIVRKDTLEGIVTIKQINARERTLTILNPKGEMKTHAIGENVTDFEKLKVGDQIYYSYTQIVTIEVKSPHAKP